MEHRYKVVMDDKEKDGQKVTFTVKHVGQEKKDIKETVLKKRSGREKRTRMEGKIERNTFLRPRSEIPVLLWTRNPQ